MTYYSRTSLANRALDLVGKDTVLDLDASTTPVGKLVQRNFNTVFLRCLRRAQWPFAIKRVVMSPDVATPINQYSAQFSLPADCFKVVDISPRFTDHKIEGKKLLANENEVTIKYVSDESLQDPEKVDPCFAEWFAHELALAISYRLTDSVALRKELRDQADTLFKEAAALFSQEGEDDPIPDSPWIGVRGLPASYWGTIKIEGLE